MPVADRMAAEQPTIPVLAAAAPPAVEAPAAAPNHQSPHRCRPSPVSPRAFGDHGMAPAPAAAPPALPATPAEWRTPIHSQSATRSTDSSVLLPPCSLTNADAMAYRGRCARFDMYERTSGPTYGENMRRQRERHGRRWSRNRAIRPTAIASSPIPTGDAGLDHVTRRLAPDTGRHTGSSNRARPDAGQSSTTIGLSIS